MKKHIKKKFLHETDLTPEIIKKLDESGLKIPLDRVHTINKFPKGFSPFLTTDDNKFFKAFTFKFQNINKLIPEPDPILVYFHAAYLNYIEIENRKKAVFSKLLGEKLTEDMIKELYDYFSVTSSFVVLLFTSLEALINRCIPNGYNFKRVSERKTELFSKKQIELHIPFDQKINEVLKEATKKSFKKDHPTKYTHISNLKEFRNMIIHTKEAEGESTYDYLFKKSLTFNYNETLDAVKDFCNFYTKPDFIIECDCSQNW